MVSESTWRVHIVLMFILARNYNGFVVDMDSLGWIMVEFTKEFQRFLSGCRLSYTSGYVRLRNRSKRLPVLRDHKVLPEVRNRPLLPREIFKSPTLKKWWRIQYWKPPFHHFNIRYTYGSKLQLEKFLGGWCVMSCKSIQFPKFKVQA